MNNYEKIKTMNIDQLARFIYAFIGNCGSICVHKEKDHCINFGCYSGIDGWLRSCESQVIAKAEPSTV